MERSVKKWPLNSEDPRKTIKMEMVSGQTIETETT
jgi:hypothetical protein